MQRVKLLHQGRITSLCAFDKSELTQYVMIARVWHGWTSYEEADHYEQLLREEILPEIASRELEGYEGSEVLRRPLDNEVEFMTILWFDSMEGVRQFVGEETRQAHVPDEAQRLLHRYDDQARHYEHRDRISS